MADIQEERDRIVKLTDRVQIRAELEEHRAFLKRRKYVGDPDLSASVVSEHEEIVQLLKDRLKS